MKTINLSIILLLTIFFIAAGCNKNDDDKDNTDNGVPANTLVVNGVNVSLPLITCSQYSSGYHLRFTASDLAQEHFLEIYFNDWPTSEKTFAVSMGGSGAEARGDYTVNGNVEYVTQSGTITVTPKPNDKFTVTFKDVVTKSGSNVQAMLSFNGTCN